MMHDKLLNIYLSIVCLWSQWHSVSSAAMSVPLVHDKDIAGVLPRFTGKKSSSSERSVYFSVNILFLLMYE